MTQVLYDGRKAINMDELITGDAGWRTAGNDVPLSEDVRLYYERVGLLYRCTHIRADALSKVPWVIVDDNDETLWTKGDVPPVNLLWLRNLSRLLHKTEAALSLGSQAYWHKERNRVRVTGLRWFAPLATAPWWDAERGLTHFVRNIGVRVENIPPRDMVYLRYEYPLHETLRDPSPAEAALAAAGVLYNVDDFIAKFFERGAIKATLLTVKGNPPKSEMDRIKAWWKRFFQGVANAFGAEVLNAEGLTPVVVGEGIGELSNTDLTTEKRHDLVSTMGVPLSMIFADAANYATAEQDTKNFYNSTIVPDCELIAEQVDEQLLAEMGLHLVFKPESMDMFQTDEAERAQSFVQYVSAGIRPSIAAGMLGLELPDGWEYEDLDREAEDDAAATEASNGESVDEDDPALASEARRFKAWARKRQHPNPDDFQSRLLTAGHKAVLLAEVEAYKAQRKEGGADQDFFPLTLTAGPITHDAYKALQLQLDPDDDEAEQRIRLEIERRLSRELYPALRGQLAELLPDGASDEVIRSAVERVEATSGAVREVLRRELEQAASLGVTVALDTLMQLGLGFDWTLAHADAARWASQYSFELVRNINRTTQQRVQVAVNDWFNERTTLPDLVRELEPTFGRRRAQLIAQTETTRAASEGSNIGFEASGVVAEVEIRTANDERVCVVCGPKHGTRTPLRGGTVPPFHVGCRCWVAPVVEEVTS